MADHPFTGTLSVTGNVGIGAEPLPEGTRLFVKTSEPSGLLNQVLIENSAGTLLKLAVDGSGAAIGTETGTTLPLSLQTNGTSRLSINNAGAIAISGPLTVQNTLSVTGNASIGTAATPTTLEIPGTIQAGNGAFTGPLTVQNALTVTGNVTIGTVATPATLNVPGTIQAGNGTFTGSLTVQNALTVTGNIALNSGTLQVTGGAITPATGNSQSAGILFPLNPGGGSGDAAWMRYYPRSGEACTLEIGISNDVNDHIALLPSGNVGIGTTEPNRSLTIQGSSSSTYMNIRASNGTHEVLLGADTSGGILSTMTNHDLQLRAGNNTTRIILKADGNVGIGTIEPAKARLEVAGKVGNTVALFGQGEQGISLVASQPSLGFNSYFNAGWKAISSGRSGIIDVNQNDGSLGFYTAGSSNAADAALTLTKQLNISPTGQLTLPNGGLSIKGDLIIPNSDGGTASFIGRKLDNEAGFKKNNVKLSLGSKLTNLVNAPPFEYEFAIGHTSFFTSIGGGVLGGSLTFHMNFNKVFSVNQNGQGYFAAGKAGYVVDYFVNHVGDALEQGDVVVISEYQVSLYSGYQNSIPIPEVDLTDKAYDSRVCGIVAQFVTEKDLPFVEPDQPLQIPPEGISLPDDLSEVTAETETYPHPFKEFAATLTEETNSTTVQDQQMGTMVTLGAFAHCKVDADIAPITVGDLLTTSPTRGHAQKVLEPKRAVGAIIGKALSSLDKGKGKIPVMVMLQ